MSTTVDPILMSHAAEPSRRRTMMPMMTPTKAAATKTTTCGGAPVFSKTMKCDPTTAVGLPKLSAQTSLLDVIRTQGHAMLAVESQIRPLSTRATTSRTGRTIIHSKSFIPPSPPPPQIKKTTSKPIRIVASTKHHRDDVENEEEDPLSSSAELERFYDQATWRMYILIQSARLANETPPALKNNTAAAGGFRGRVPTTSHSHAPYQQHHHSNTSATTTNNGGISTNHRWTTQCPSSSGTVAATATFMDSEEDIFEMEL